MSRGTDHVVMDVGGVGYRIFVPRQPGSDAATLHTHHVVREDAQQLFGFESLEELRLFEMLLDVPGVGPRAALSLLATAEPSAIAAAIATGDTAALARAPGVGRKTAERLVVELRARVKGLAPAGVPASTLEDEALAALVALGYSALEATRALREVPAGDTTERVRAALRGMAR